MPLTLLPPEPRTGRRRGRPSLTESPDDVRRMIACAKFRLLCGAGRDKIARYYGVCPRTVSYWTRRALEMDGPEGDALRRLAADRRAS